MVDLSLEKQLDEALHTSIDAVRDVFEKIYDKYKKLVYFLVSKSITCKEDCEDLTNEVFLGFFNNVNNFDTSRSIKYYLMTSARNKVTDYLKSKKDNVSYDDSIEVEDAKREEHVYKEFIDEWSSVTNEFEIKVIIEHVIYDYSFKEIAEMNNVSVNTVKSAYRRGILKIRKYYEDQNKKD